MGRIPSNAERIAHAYRMWAETKGASVDLLLDLMGEEVVMTTALDPQVPHPLAQTRIGKEYARDYLDSLALNLEMIAYPTEEVVDGGDTVVWIGSGHWRDRASGREAWTRKVDIWWFRDGQVVRVLEMFDTLGFALFNKLAQPL